MYDHSPYAKTLEKYIDFDKLRPKGNPNTRLKYSNCSEYFNCRVSNI